MSNVTSCFVYPPQITPCGEYGICLPNNTTSCQCATGFSSFGDFSIFNGNPCDIHIITIQILWGTVILSTLFADFFCIWGLYSRYRAQLISRKAWRLWGVPLLVLLQSSFLLVMSIGKITQPTDWIIGKQVIITSLHGFASLFTVSFLVFGLAGISRTAYRGEIRGKSFSDQMERKWKMKRLEYAIVFFWISSAIGAFLPCSALIDPQNIWWSTALHGTTFAVEMAILGAIVAPRQLGTIIEILQENIKSNETSRVNPDKKLEKVLIKFKLAKRVAMNIFTIGSVIVFIFTVWPFLVVKIAYSLPIFYILLEVIAGSLIWVTTTTSQMNFRKSSLAMKRISQAFSSVTGGRKSQERKLSATSRKSQERRHGTSGIMTGGENRLSLERKALLSPSSPQIATELL